MVFSSCVLADRPPSGNTSDYLQRHGAPFPPPASGSSLHNRNRSPHLNFLNSGREGLTVPLSLPGIPASAEHPLSTSAAGRGSCAAVPASACWRATSASSGAKARFEASADRKGPREVSGGRSEGGVKVYTPNSIA
ncbi:MAG: hypothetical protein BJ554DRAFT_448 [Olpidium bornovanus]|uniref:Uncharacterized protein n=1 Tax=Olpidium bornovanus TaxID=278681 RepID=A0A8H7ZTK1_9FUNG|nr:MAG: hypothetical protein BJ554DRAFT_448 [Olpidium bornovanus]